MGNSDVSEVVHGLFDEELGKINDEITVLLVKLEKRIREKYVTDKEFQFDLAIGVNQCSGFEDAVEESE
ncbi:MAG: hypothetical protein C4555_05980 [Dehalococcoidia bacterium]|nr:MAG: hypothetical protein C4555_05980 [Dehalococcoidia bacterium]